MMRKTIFFLTITLIYSLPVHFCFANMIDAERNKHFCSDYDINYEEAKKIANNFNNLVQANDKKNVAKMIHFPVEITKSKKSGERISYQIKTEKEFLEQYHSLFNKKNKNLLNNDHNLVCNSLGRLDVAGGTFWFNEDLKIISISLD